MKRTRLVVVAAVAALGLGALAFYSARILFAESLYTTRGAYAYWIALSPIIRGVPEVAAISPAQFYSSAGDGPKPPENTVSYRSGAQVEQIHGQIVAYLIANGYQRRSGALEAKEFAKGHSIITVTIQPDPNGGAGHLVTVSEVF